MMYSRAFTKRKINGGASRYGIDGSLIDFGKESEVNTGFYCMNCLILLMMFVAPFWKPACH